MTAEETQRVLDLLSEGKLGLSWVAHATVGVVALIGAYLGAYLRKRGENYAIKQDLEGLTRIAEQIRAQVSDASWQGQRFWEEKKTIYVDIIKGLNKICDGLWEHLLHGFNERTHERIDSPARLAAAQGLLRSLDHYLQYTGIAFVFLSDQAHAAMRHFSDESKRLHDQLVADRDEYSYYSNLKKVAGETYDRMIVAAKAELSASLRRP